MDKIFVSIASYRDPELPKTIADCLKNAVYPGRVTIGVINQIDIEKDDDCKAPDHPSVKQIIVPAHEGKGVCWARHRIFKELLTDEDIVLQIDSHSRFDKGWDMEVTKQLQQVADPKAVLSHYPLTYVPLTEEKGDRLYVRFAVVEFNSDGFPTLGNTTTHLEHAPDGFERTALIAGGCFFTRADTVRHVPYDPHLYFTGEELNYATRLWTHGYNLYLPHRPFLYHDYHAPRAKPRHMHSIDNVELYRKLWVLSMKRMRHTLGIEQSHDPEVVEGLDEFTWGGVRTLQQWQQHFGVNFVHQLICHGAKTGRFPQSSI